MQTFEITITSVEASSGPSCAIWWSMPAGSVLSINLIWQNSKAWCEAPIKTFSISNIQQHKLVLLIYFVKNQSTIIASKLTDSTREVLGTHFSNTHSLIRWNEHGSNHFEWDPFPKCRTTLISPNKRVSVGKRVSSNPQFGP